MCRQSQEGRAASPDMKLGTPLRHSRHACTLTFGVAALKKTKKNPTQQFIISGDNKNFWQQEKKRKKRFALNKILI